MFKMIHNFIARIQNSDESAKKFWLFLLSGVTMIVVIALWITYMRFTVASVPAAPDAPAIANAQPETPGFFAIFGAGLKVIYDQVSALIGEKIAEKNNVIIQNPDRNFVLEGLPVISPTKLR